MANPCCHKKYLVTEAQEALLTTSQNRIKSETYTKSCDFGTDRRFYSSETIEGGAFVDQTLKEIELDVAVTFCLL